MTRVRDPRVTSKIMSSVHSTNTKVELALMRELKLNGLRLKQHYDIVGTPDLAFPKEKIAVFCDGDFWHGNNWRIRGYSALEDDFKSNKSFWVNKIRNNVKRDRRVNKALRNKGWKVLRIWESSIKKDLKKCAKYVVRVVNQRRKSVKRRL